jgi:peroxiredoxin
MMRTLAIASLGAALFTGTVTAATYSPRVGTRHPNFTLPRTDDRSSVSLSDFRGKKVLLIQFASW